MKDSRVYSLFSIVLYFCFYICYREVYCCSLFRNFIKLGNKVGLLQVFYLLKFFYGELSLENEE